jgi:hypothetical protein
MVLSELAQADLGTINVLGTVAENTCGGAWCQGVVAASQRRQWIRDMRASRRDA